MKNQINQSAIELKEVELRDVCEVKKGNSITKNTITEGNIPVIAGGQQPAYYHNASNRTGETLTVSGSGAYSGFVAYFSIPIFASDCSTIQVKDKQNISTKYVYLFLKSKQDSIYKLQKGIAQPHVYPKDLEIIKIPLPFRNGHPDLETQKAIVSILEKAEQLKEKRKQSIKLLDGYVKSVFNEMFVNKDFEREELGKITKIVAGSTPSTSRIEYWEGNIDWITPAELIDGDNYYYSNTERKITEEGIASCSSELFPKGTVMLTTRAPIGKVAIAGVEMCSNQGFKNFIPSNKIISEYLYYWFLVNKDYLNSLGVGATFKEISKSMVSKIKIPLPPLPLQQTFASIVEHVERLKEKQNKSLQEIEQLFNALMQKAFNGELVR